MNKNEIIKISTDDRDWLISLKSCDQKSDGQFIRQLTKENFYDCLSKIIGWNEKRHQEEPKFPERYLMQKFGFGKTVRLLFTS